MIFLILIIIGPLLCYSFGKENLKRCNISDYDLKNNDTIIFSLGEIDCRCHIIKHINEKMTYKTIIKIIIDMYIDAIKINVDKSELTFKNICIYNPSNEKRFMYTSNACKY